MNTRAIAADILIRIRDEGAYSNVLLPQATKDLSGPDRAFVYSLVTGALRRLRLVDDVIEEVAGRKLADLDPEVSAVLEVAIAEMITDDRGNVYATVNESVEAIKHLDRARAARLVNGVLRGLDRNGLPELERNPARDVSVPDWIVQVLITDHGRDEALDLLDGLRNMPPTVSVRVRPGASIPEGSVPIAGIPDTYGLTGRPRAVPGVVFADGASSAVALAVAPRPGETVLDMAAAPGGKTMSLWDQSGGQATIVAMDRHGRRLRSAKRRLDKENVRPCWMTADASNAPFADAVFDAVLLDAPCTGLGTLRRRPEIAMRLEGKAPNRMAEKQRAMLAEAWRITRPGGRIVYSVCTVFAAETVDVVAGYPAAPPPGVPGRQWGSGLLMAPHSTGTDGMYIATIDKT
ncbi:MAG: methyltransferase domain-containing protein [bacterium]|nr:methyltransferase domain-containing protein [bacterium]